ncbi:Stk1 family PASTA domain-containing Ser/Thr kinase [Veillonella caviae]|uniref:Stk1 family PASTA domain-containing Ser/Thr kinase n=1 Tax=Veillonella caviae TaxID=248316 RepID=UPI0023A7972D|nr:Stk1 family PASTA domain-containing Ser/Thr kinase [Veillonella caviae]MCI5708539.1 Stk1 family PASTA domain-containing Ser/Thr kinase [Veillonella caviae]MCI7693421.1 Stk1 family PASTA domain-containing Ser/Thr kinase [Veillonella caviae]MDD7290699.1 Stk1 family PASTA domain-containing Ser/Thr kinase [Veillonella caviae]MDY4746078.1 Stk1 family PASTA domain-containing Ser/Thr kinase [Veillonella caviae]MDY5253606.1 Stk1 family PASTA domain-containing Ser/Thr kinase [Veillonella caviae]
MNIKNIVLDNRYRIIDKIGVGGMADVYRGEDTLLGRPVAIKILHANFANDDEFVSRFKREAQAAGKLNHPNIVNMYDVGFDQDLHYIIMEYVDGKTLKEYITEKGRLSIDEAVKFTIAIGEGLEHAHAMGIVHCDIKPHNVIITRTGRVKVTDFGIARAMNSTNTVMYTNSIMGSAHYLSPEQASGKTIDGSTDIYSLGVVLYEMLSGKVPFEGETPIAVALKHVREKVIPPTRYNPSIPPLLESVVLKALSKDPKDRFESISDMMSDLRLSQGFTMSKTQRHEPYDFATQMIPAVDPDAMDEFSTDDDTTSKEVKKKTMLSKIASIPQKYIVLSAAVIFLIAFLGAFLSYGNFWSNTTVDVPNVVGKQVSVAKNMLEDKHLRVSTSEVTNTDIPAGQVISQTPGAGEKVKEQRTIHLVVSKGVGDITVPDLSGLSLEQARQRLKDIGLVVGKITQQSMDGKPDNVIIAQTPSGDSKVAKGTTVDVVVNKAKAKKVKMPDLIGMTLKDARDVLASHNLSVNQIVGSIEEKSVVTNQSTKSGDEIDEGTAINLTTEFKEEKKKEESKQSSSNRTKGTVDVTVPSGSKKQELRIVVKDDEGSTVIYDDVNKPGDRIVKNVSGVGNVRIEVYLNGALVQDTTL